MITVQKTTTAPIQQLQSLCLYPFDRDDMQVLRVLRSNTQLLLQSTSLSLDLAIFANISPPADGEYLTLNSSYPPRIL